MKIKEIAEKLDGMEYGEKIDSDILDYAAFNNIVIVTGYSDDNIEFSGAIEDEVGCYDGGTAYLDGNGLIHNECPEDECPYYRRLLKIAKTIDALWCEEKGYSWTYKTDIPHETFDVVEDDRKYCRGIIFDLADLG